MNPAIKEFLIITLISLAAGVVVGVAMALVASPFVIHFIYYATGWYIGGRFNTKFKPLISKYM
jgi:hypothetical protein